MSCPSRPSLGDVPRSLPSFLLAHCGDSASWIYSDQRCDGVNNCGDCSDELSPGGGLGTGGRGRGQGRGGGALRSPVCSACILGGFPLPLGLLWIKKLGMREPPVDTRAQRRTEQTLPYIFRSEPSVLGPSQQPCEKGRAGLVAPIHSWAIPSLKKGAAPIGRGCGVESGARTGGCPSPP